MRKRSATFTSAAQAVSGPANAYGAMVVVPRWYGGQVERPRRIGVSNPLERAGRGEKDEDGGGSRRGVDVERWRGDMGTRGVAIPGGSAGTGEAGPALV